MTAPWTPGRILAPIDLTPVVIRAIKGALAPAQVAAITAWREAESAFVRGRGWVPNPIEAMLDILTVIGYRAHNPTRRRWRTLDIKGICLERWAFSCWEPKGGPDDPKDADELAENFEAVMAWAQRLLAGQLPSPDVSSERMLLQCLAAAEALEHGRFIKTLPDDTCHYWATWMPKAPDWAYFDPKTRLKPRAPVAERFGHLYYAGVP